MSHVLKKWLMPAAVLLSVLSLAMPCSAQVFTGRVDVTVADSTGAMLPGATVDLTGPVNVVETDGCPGHGCTSSI